MANTFELIQALTNLSGYTSVTFSNIPQTYNDLLFMWSGRENIHNGHLFGKMTLNNNYGSNKDIYLYGGGSTTSISQGGNWDSAAQAYLTQGMWNANGSTASFFSNNDVYIPKYTESNQMKTYFSSGYGGSNGTGDYSAAFMMSCGKWSQNAALTEVVFYSYQGTYAAYAGTSFYLYGIKNT